MGAAALALALLAGAASAADTPEKRVALVIGESLYQYAPRLANTTNDARLVAKTLQELGFELVGGGAQLDLDKAGFEQAVRTFYNQLTNSSVGVFYYAGHGLRMQKINYMVPVDANPTKPTDAGRVLISANQVLRKMGSSGTRLKVMILDACRNNPFARRGGGDQLRNRHGGLIEMRAPVGTIISYATQPGNVAQDGPSGGDSPYTLALVGAMKRPGLSALDMFNQIGVQVDKVTGGMQQPWIGSSPIDGEYYFAGPGGARAPAVAR